MTGEAGPTNPQPPPSAPPLPPEPFDPDGEYNEAPAPEARPAEEEAFPAEDASADEPLELESERWEEGARPFDPGLPEPTENGPALPQIRRPRMPAPPRIELPKPHLKRPRLPRLPRLSIPRPRLRALRRRGPEPERPTESPPEPAPAKPSPPSPMPKPKTKAKRPPAPEALPSDLARARARKRTRAGKVPRGARPKRRPAPDPRERLDRPTPAPPKPRRPPDRRAELSRGTQRGRPARRRSRQRTLLVPTAKAAIAIAACTGAAAALGSVIGLPLPGESKSASNLAGASLPVGEGTAVTLSEGPYHPIKVELVNYGEFAARFGGGRSHEGQDMFAGVGTPLVSVRSGKVVDTSIDHGAYAGGRGNYLYIYSPQDGRSYGYFHMKNPPTLRIGDKVAAGQEVGALGCTGSCYGPHLHFEIRIGKASFGADTKPIDPLAELKRWPPVPGSTRGTGLPQSPPFRVKP